MTNFKVNIEEQKGNQSVVSIEPLEAGYGHTLGNSLKRVMLTSIPGAAITSVKISGVSHQFSTINGVIEDVIQIILNLKKVHVKIYGEKSIRLSINKTGLGPVTAGDIDLGGLGEITNPEQVIATITDPKVKLSMEMTAEMGVGYSPAEDRKSAEIGVMVIDAIFTPILSVNYYVEQTRVGRRTDFDRVVLEITTDGSIDPKEAVENAAKILTEYFHQVYEPSEDVEVAADTTASSSVSDDTLKASVEELDLPVRITNALKAIEIDTIGKLLTVQPTTLMKAKNLGAKSLTLISEKLSERGLSLSEA